MFEKIIGNEENKKMLEQIIINKKYSHSYIFVGQVGVGKFLFAKEFASKILNNGNLSISEENLTDLFIINPDGNSIKIEQIRDITKKITEKPIESDKKIYIINDSQTMTREAQNSLLKTLEEPPEYAIIILVASTEDYFLPTIKSRCATINFEKLSKKEISQILEKKHDNINEKEILELADGSAEKAIQLTNKQDEYMEIIDIVNNLKERDILYFLSLKERLFKDKENAYETLEYMNSILAKNMNNKIHDSYRYAKAIQSIEKAKNRLNKNSNYDMTIDDCLITLWEEFNG